MPWTTAISSSDMGFGTLLEKCFLSKLKASSDKASSSNVGLEFLGESLEFKLSFPSISSALSLRGRLFFLGRKEFFSLPDSLPDVRASIWEGLRFATSFASS